MLAPRDRDEIRGSALVEQQSDIALQRWLVRLDREMIVRLLFDQISGQRTLGEQGIAGHVLAGEITAL
jgi:hypothetical protein